MVRRPRIEDLLTSAVPEQPALAPDGRRLAYVLRTVDAEADRVVRSIWGAGPDDAEPRPLTHGRSDTAPAWSPDGSRLAFLRGGDGPAQLWSLPVGGGEPQQITTLAYGAGAPVWRPDGKAIAFSAAVDLLAVHDEDDAARDRRSIAPVTAERLDYQADGAGLLRGVRKHLFLLDLGTGHCRQLTDGDWHAGDPAWSPDGTRLAFGAAAAADPDLVVRVPLYVLDVTEENARPRVAGLADGVAASVTWTPDGTALLVTGMTEDPFGHAGLLRVPLDGGPVVDLAAGLDRNVMAGAPGYPGAVPQVAADGRTVLFCVRDRGDSHLYAVDVDGGPVRPVVAGAGRVVSGLSVAGDTAAVVLATPTSYGEVVTVELAADLYSATEIVRTAHSDVNPFVRQERDFTVSDGTVVHGWLIRDPAAKGPQPLLLDVHGGPHNAWNGAADEVHLYHQELAARGWTVLVLNPRGSDGYGVKFFTAARGAWGLADAIDLLEPIDQLVAEGTADPGRLALTGYSYGGYMTCYLTSRDNRFAAAVAGGAVADLTSMAGTSDAGYLLAVYELGGMPWEDPDRYAAMSPITGMGDVATPTLVLQGEQDRRCPVGQAQQWHSGLRARGVPCELVLYPGGSHLVIVDGRPSHRLDYNRRVVDWVSRHTEGSLPQIDAAHWERRLAVLAERHHVPGATLGILRLHPDGDDELVESAYGVLNVDTGIEATTDSVFQIGSISKAWTATLVMQLVDEGRLDLDEPVAKVLPELRLADPVAAAEVTMRHLLTHTSGIDGDVFTDTGRGDDCVEKYVAALSGEAQNHPLGATWSYCNSGFVLAGRVVEKLTGTNWDEAIRTRLIGPLGLGLTSTLPEEALLRRTAAGHVREGQSTVLAPVWMLPRALGPAGLINATAADLLSFARMHLTGGLAKDGTRVLSEAGAAAMAGHEVDLPEKYTLGDSWGLGWIRFGWDGQRLYGHDGNTIGQSAFLRILPGERLAIALLTNGEGAADLYRDLYGEILADLGGVAMPAPFAPPAEPVDVDVTPHLGTYERASTRLEVLDGEDGPSLRMTTTGPLAELTPEPVREFALAALEPDLFAIRLPDHEAWTPVTFYRLATGERYLHLGVRATPKVS